jgi:hypothetical protein
MRGLRFDEHKAFASALAFLARVRMLSERGAGDDTAGRYRVGLYAPKLRGYTTDE